MFDSICKNICKLAIDYSKILLDMGNGNTQDNFKHLHFKVRLCHHVINVTQREQAWVQRRFLEQACASGFPSTGSSSVGYLP